MSQNKCIGWTLQEWQTAYLNQDIHLEDLIDYVAQLPQPDHAWISIATTEILSQQIEVLKQKADQATDLSKELPLYGIPFAVKDNIDSCWFCHHGRMQGPTTVATQDAETIRLLKNAGAIVVGKTNLDQFATGLVGTRSPFGAVSNTFNADYVSGGSALVQPVLLLVAWCPLHSEQILQALAVFLLPHLTILLD